MTERRTGPPIGVVVFVGGTASLGAEMAAARLLAPWFGASTIVCANTIATVLDGGRVATDDVAPVELLIDASIVDLAADGDRGG